MQFEKFMWNSSNGCGVCYSMFRIDNKSVLSCSLPRCGWSRTLQYGIRASIFNTKPRWVEQVELKWNVTEDWFRNGKILSCRASMVNFRSNDAELGKSPIYVVKFMRKWRNLAKWWDIIGLISVLTNSDLELVKFEVTVKPWQMERV